jgi:hypothetical protein
LAGDSGSFEVGVFWACVMMTVANREATTAIVVTILIVLSHDFERGAVPQQNDKRLVQPVPASPNARQYAALAFCGTIAG